MSRAVHIDGAEYPYKITKSGVKVRTPEGKSMYFDMTEVTGWTNDALERADWKGYWPPVTPRRVKELVIECLSR